MQWKLRLSECPLTGAVDALNTSYRCVKASKLFEGSDYIQKVLCCAVSSLVTKFLLLGFYLKNYSGTDLA